MRPLLVLALGSLLLLPAAPFAAGGSASGAAYGVNGGCVDAGGWDVWYWFTGGGAVTVGLTWSRLPVLGADYDLQVYRGDALDDGVLTPDEMIGASEHHGAGPAQESVSFASLPGGTYFVAVVPYQAEGEGYDITAPGSFQYATVGPTPGVEVFEPCVI